MIRKILIVLLIVAVIGAGAAVIVHLSAPSGEVYKVKKASSEPAETTSHELPSEETLTKFVVKDEAQGISGDTAYYTGGAVFRNFSYDVMLDWISRLPYDEYGTYEFLKGEYYDDGSGQSNFGEIGLLSACHFKPENALQYVGINEDVYYIATYGGPVWVSHAGTMGGYDVVRGWQQAENEAYSFDGLDGSSVRITYADKYNGILYGAYHVNDTRYSLTVSTEHCYVTSGSATSILGFGEYRFVFTARNGCEFGESCFTVTGASCNSSMSGGVLTLNVFGATDDVVITVTAEQTTTYTLTKNGSYCTLNGPDSILADGSATLEIVPDEFYVLPSTVSVEGASCDYDSSTGIISLYGATGDVTVSVTCEYVDPNEGNGDVDPNENEYTNFNIVVYVDNGTYSGASQMTNADTDVAVSILPESGYTYPADVTVTGAIGTYDSSTGIVLLNAASEDVTISASCVAEQQEEQQE